MSNPNEPSETGAPERRDEDAASTASPSLGVTPEEGYFQPSQGGNAYAAARDPLYADDASQPHLPYGLSPDELIADPPEDGEANGAGIPPGFSTSPDALIADPPEPFAAAHTPEPAPERFQEIPDIKVPLVVATDADPVPPAQVLSNSVFQSMWSESSNAPRASEGHLSPPASYGMGSKGRGPEEHEEASEFQASEAAPNRDLSGSWMRASDVIPGGGSGISTGGRSGKLVALLVALVVIAGAAGGAFALGLIGSKEDPGRGGKVRSGAPLSKKQYIARADKICSRADKAAPKRPNPLTPQNAVAYMDASVAAGEAEMAALWKLNPPKKDRKVVDKMLGKFDQALSALKRMAAAAKKGDAQSMSNAANEGQADALQGIELAKDYGLRECSKVTD